MRPSCQAWKRIVPPPQVKEESVLCSWDVVIVPVVAGLVVLNNEEIFVKFH